MGLSGKESACQWRRCGFNSWVRKISWRRKCNPLQYSCLENPMDRGAWRLWTIGLQKCCIHWPLVSRAVCSGARCGLSGPFCSGRAEYWGCIGRQRLAHSHTLALLGSARARHVKMVPAWVGGPRL